MFVKFYLMDLKSDVVGDQGQALDGLQANQLDLVVEHVNLEKKFSFLSIWKNVILKWFFFDFIERFLVVTEQFKTSCTETYLKIIQWIRKPTHIISKFVFFQLLNTNVNSNLLKLAKVFFK